MKLTELRELIKGGALKEYARIYSDVSAQTERFLRAIDSFSTRYGEDREVYLLSVPGRSEIIGNHTDHNGGRVLAGAIDRDIIAVAAKREDGLIRFYSEGYPEESVTVSETSNPEEYDNYSSRALIAGMVNGFVKEGYEVGGFDVYATSEVLKGSGISSSAAYEVMIGNTLNYLYNDGKIDNAKIARLAQYAENVYFGKPCGLMDQTACAVGGFVYIDFEDSAEPKIEAVDFSLSERGYELCIVNTGGNHANLNDDYASVPQEMRAVARLLGRDVLRGLTEEDIVKNIPNLRRNVGDRAILRSLHFLRENERVSVARSALKSGDVDAFFKALTASGKSSFELLQNVYTTINVKEQGLSVALALTEGFLDGEGAYRVHGGGFAGTIQAFVPKARAEEYADLLDSVFGEDATMRLNIRSLGACRLY